MDQPMEDQQRLERIDELLLQALELEADRRAAFLDAACDGDAELRREVLDLLSRDVDTGDLLKDSPASGLRRKAQADALRVGERISHYRVEARIGRGGMGEVWRAWDEQLKREVAIKILPPEFAANPERVRRFEQEAYTVSALNHPNIITIFEIVQTGNVHFIATEYVEGQTLRQSISDGRLSLQQKLKLTIQIAEALLVAHEAGIVHRDIKPENVMVRRDGYVKVLDFGIAKSSEQSSTEPAGLKPARTDFSSVTGALMGTVSYMSPEQARGERVDARTDLFSLGIVLYEMVTGRKPFEGAVSTEVIAAILENEPQMASFPLTSPNRLRQIVSRALRKDREDRYQTAAEMLDDLKSLARETEVKVISSPQGADAPAERAQARDLPASPAWRLSLSARFVLAALSVALLGVIVWKLKPAFERGRFPAKTAEVTQFTYHGKVTNTAISRDGKYVVYTMNEAGRQSLWLRDVNSADQRVIIPPVAHDEFYGPTFSPDSQNIFYLRYEEKSDTKALFQVSILGGPPRKVMDHVDNAIAFAPDGKRFAFVRNSPQGKESSLMVVNVDGSGETSLLTRKEPLKFSFGWQWPLYSWNGRVAWSPDGKRIAFAVGTAGTEMDHQLFVIPADGGPERVLAARKWWRIIGIDWVADGNDVFVLAAEQQLSPFRVWHLTLADAEARQIVHDPNSYYGLSATADGRGIVSLLADQRTTIWRALAADPNNYTSIPSGKTDGRLGLRWTPGNKILFDSSANGPREIWVMEADGTNRQRLTSGAAADERPEVSSDGQFIAYVSRQKANDVPHVWLMDRNGDNRKQLTNGSGEYEAQFSPDGRWVIYISKDANGKASVWKMPVAGGPAVQITAEQTEEPVPVISPDGKLLAYYKGLGLQWKQIEVLTWDGLQIKHSFEVKRTAYLLRWTPDGRALTYADTEDEVTNLWKQALSGGKPKQITFFKTDKIGRFDWSRDGKYLICSRHAWQRDAFLIKYFR